MPIEVKLFGDLRKKIEPKILGTTSLRFEIDDSEVDRIIDLLKKINIEENEVSHIFVNGRYAGLRKKIQNRDTVALFPKNMGLLYKWYFKREEDE
ncbi:MAG: MoaD/ThiS family protein [Candidatus Lokiarchaeota archaeon]|nr:MoaD/ThiS family protein [Candidatus Lokiarchaeota archaeon]